MKIAIDIRSAGGEKTGKGFYTFNLVQNLLSLDKENEYILYCKEGVSGFQHFKNAELRRIEGRGMAWHFKVLKDLKTQKPDIFWAPSSYIIPALISKKIKTIITVHDLVAFYFPENHNKKATIIEKIFLRRALKKAELILTVSQNTKKDVLEEFEFCKSKDIEVIYCAASENFKHIPAQDLKEFAKKTKLPAKFFLAVGTLEPRKNYKKLIRAFKTLSDHYPEYHLIIVGKEGWQYEGIYEEICSSYLQKKVHILGYLSGTSLVNLYNLAQALVFPSVYEGFGIPPLEAMKCGCPVVASSAASIPEVVGKAALLVDPHKEQEIAMAMERIITNHELAKKLHQSSLLQSKKFSWGREAQKLQRLISK